MSAHVPPLPGEPWLRGVGLCKAFGGATVLRGVSLDVRRGEVVAVVGENGAGKSTLVKILAGLLQPDSGRLYLDGEERRLRSPHAAALRGIAMIHQELMPFPELSVAENVMLGREPVRGVGGWLDWRGMRRSAEGVLARLDPRLSPGERMGTLPVARQQLVEIARALVGQARLLIMDEPTSALAAAEAEGLLRLVGELRASGVSILYITHRLEEVFRVADRVVVLRDGLLVASESTAALTSDRLISLMVGREVGEIYPRIASQPGAVKLEVRDLGRSGAFRGVSFAVRAGEVVGLAGLMGAGRSEVLRAIYGLEPADQGSIFVDGQELLLRTPAKAQQAGLILVTEDRQRDGLVPTLDVRSNLTLASLARWCWAGWVSGVREAAAAEERANALGVRGAGLGSPVRLLSGGNQQKVLLGRALLTRPRILLLDEPTRGIDVGAKQEVYRLIATLAREGMAILLVSSELPELLALSHRIVVLSAGCMVAELDGSTATAEQVMQRAVGGVRGPAAGVGNRGDYGA